MTGRLPVHGIDPDGVPDGTYLLRVAAGAIVGLESATDGGGSLTVQDEDGDVATGVTQIDFQGAGVTAVAGPGSGEIVVTIPGGGGGGGGGGGDGTLSVNAQTTTAYTATASDAGAVVTMTNAADSTFTLPPSSSDAIPVGADILVMRRGAGKVNIVAGAGVTLRAPFGSAISPQYGVARAVQLAANEWVITGNLSFPGPVKLALTPSSNRTAYDTYTIANMVDENLATKFWIGGSTAVGDHVTVDIGSVKTITEVRVNQGAGGEQFPAWVLERSTDNVTWTTIQSGSLQNISATGLSLSARWVRLRATSTGSGWPQFFDFSVWGS